MQQTHTVFGDLLAHYGSEAFNYYMKTSSFFSCRIMTGNHLTTLLSGNFSVYPNLEVLVLDDNLLTSVPAEGLDSLPQLTNLWV